MTAMARVRPAALNSRVPGDWVLHWIPLLAAGTLALNDHVLKAHHASWWTGKLSDAAGLVFFPLLLVAAWELLRWAAGRPWRASPETLLVAIGVTALVFSLVNVSGVAGDAYESMLRIVWWHFVATPSMAARVHHTVDPTDLFTLPFLVVPWWLGRRR